MPPPEQPASRNNRIKAILRRLQSSRQNHYLAIRSNVWILIIPLIVFAAMSAAGLSIILLRNAWLEKSLKKEALRQAESAGALLEIQFYQAIAPVFSLAQFVHEVDDFRGLSHKIGNAFDSDSLPFATPTHRNTTGVCDDAPTVQRFNEIAATIKRNAKMEGILVSLQLAPKCVVCLVYPLINHEDFPSGQPLNNTGAIGHDLVTDPKRSVIAKQTLQGDDAVVAGPLELVQCDGCYPAVKKALIVRLPIIMEGEYVKSNTGGRFHNRWGFAVALINWQALIDRHDLLASFQARGMAFRLTRIDQDYDSEQGTYNEVVVEIAESPEFGFDDNPTVSALLETTKNEWTVTVSYSDDKLRTSTAVSIAAVLIMSLMVLILAYTIGFQKHVHSGVVAQSLVNAQAVARSERSLNEFIAHELRNPLSAAISACSFWQSAASKGGELALESFETKSEEEVTRLVAPNRVFDDIEVIMTSLNFMNDMLSSIVDIYRATDGDIELQAFSTNVRHDILEPVVAMIRRVDHVGRFVIEIDCVDSLVILADRLRLMQVVLNLAQNSAKFVKKGFVRLRGEAGSDKCVIISVEDSGPGIVAEHRESMFSKFQDNLDLLSQGKGVGLCLCRALVEAMQGEIFEDEAYDSGIDKCPGARFVIKLPNATILSNTNNDDEDELDAGVGQFAIPGSNSPLPVTPEFYDDEEQGPSIVTPELNRKEEGGLGSDSPSPVTPELPRSEVGGLTSDPPKPLDVLPRSDSSIPVTSELPSVSQAGALPKKLSVLVVDDERILRSLATRALHALSPEWNIKQAATGEEALTVMNMEQFDLVFMDNYMSNVQRSLTGTETVREMRRRGICSIVCGVSANELEKEFLEVGADSFLLKPFPCKKDKLENFLLTVLRKDQ